MTMFRLCREFGWTPAQVRSQRATDIEATVFLLDELGRIDQDARTGGGTTILVRDD